MLSRKSEAIPLPLHLGDGAREREREREKRKFNHSAPAFPSKGFIRRSNHGERVTWPPLFHIQKRMWQPSSFFLHPSLKYSSQGRISFFTSSDTMNSSVFRCKNLRIWKRVGAGYQFELLDRLWSFQSAFVDDILVKLYSPILRESGTFPPTLQRTLPVGNDKSQNCGNKLNQKSWYFKVMLNDSEIKLKYLLFPLRCHCKFDGRRRASDWPPSWWCRTADEPSRSYLWLLWHGRLLLFGSLITVLRNLSDSAPEGYQEKKRKTYQSYCHVTRSTWLIQKRDSEKSIKGHERKK